MSRLDRRKVRDSHTVLIHSCREYDVIAGVLRPKPARKAAAASLSPRRTVGFKLNPSMADTKLDLASMFDDVAVGPPATQAKAPAEHVWKSPKGDINSGVGQLGDVPHDSQVSSNNTSSDESEFSSPAEFMICTKLPLEVQLLVRDLHADASIYKIVPNVGFHATKTGFGTWSFAGGAYWDSLGNRYIIDETEISECWEAGYYPGWHEYPTYEQQFPTLHHCLEAKLRVRKCCMRDEDDLFPKEQLKFCINSAYRYSSCAFTHHGLLNVAVGEFCLWYLDLHMVQYDEFWVCRWCPFLSFIGIANWTNRPLADNVDWAPQERAVWDWLHANSYNHWSRHEPTVIQWHSSSDTDSEFDDVV